MLLNISSWLPSRVTTTPFPPALYKLGLLYESSDVQRAQELYRSGAEFGHAACQFKFGYLHEMMGDYATASAYYYYLRSSEQGYSPAQHQLALLYLDKKAAFPSSLPSSSPTHAAKALLLSAALQNYPPSHFILATKLHHDAFLHLEYAVALRYGPALENLRRAKDGSLWTEEDCLEIKQPDFPFLVPLAAQSHFGDEEQTRPE
jgi:TPR repeat protein